MKTSTQQRITELTASGKWESNTLHGLLAKNAVSRPNHLALKDQPNREALNDEKPKQLSWAELDRASDNLARQLQALGLGEDDRVIIQLPNIIELPLMYYTLSKMGAIASPVPIQYGRHELQHIATELNASAIISISRFGKAKLAEAAKSALPNLNILVFGEQLHLDTSQGDGFSSIPTDDANRVLTICWTSGTTGTPKGVPRSHNMSLAAGLATSNASNNTPEDILLCPFPMVNISALGGFLFPAVLHGCTVVLHHPLDLQLYLQQLQDEHITYSIAPPALLNQLAKTPEMWHEFNFSALRQIGSGSAPLAPWMIETFSKEFGIEVINIYGSNEGIALYSNAETAPDPLVRATMFPRPSDNGPIQTRVADPETGEEVFKIGGKGELLVTGATVFDGYWKHDNADIFSKDGYFRTGDLVEICGETGDFYRIAGRCKDIINRGGMKISPFELDSLLEQHPDLVEAAVCAYPDERLGEKICACLVMKPGVELMSIKSMQDYLLGLGVAKFKLPELIVAYEALPRNAVGKVQRFELQDTVSVNREG